MTTTGYLDESVDGATHKHHSTLRGRRGGVSTGRGKQHSGHVSDNVSVVVCGVSLCDNMECG